MGKKSIVIVIISLVIGGGAGFYGGIKYQQGKAPQRGNFSFAAGSGAGGARFMAGGGRRGGSRARGNIKQDDKRI